MAKKSSRVSHALLETQVESLSNQVAFLLMTLASGRVIEIRDPSGEVVALCSFCTPCEDKHGLAMHDKECPVSKAQAMMRKAQKLAGKKSEEAATTRGVTP